jgi:4-hydroxybenzoate polyprenyltransferase
MASQVLKSWLIFSLGVVLMRSAGCVINDWADRDFDGHVATHQRPPYCQWSFALKRSSVFICIFGCVFGGFITLFKLYQLFFGH